MSPNYRWERRGNRAEGFVGFVTKYTLFVYGFNWFRLLMLPMFWRYLVYLFGQRSKSLQYVFATMEICKKKKI